MNDFREKSFWLEGGDYSANPTLDSSQSSDVCIIGGGFTGLSTAFHLKQLDPALKVILLESDVIGYGASGRNGGFAMTLFGLTLSITSVLFGKEKAAQAHHYMEQAVDFVDEIVKKHNMACDYERNGFLRVATTESFVKRIRHEIDKANELGLEGISWLDKDELAEQVRSPLYLGAWWEPRCAIINPAKMAWEWKRIAEASGVAIHEGTPVESVMRDGAITVKTSNGPEVTCEKVVFATNAWSHFFPEIKSRQVPAFTYIVLTEPLSDEEFNQIGWQNRQGIEDPRNLVHYYRLTADNRLLMGGSDVGLVFGMNMDRDRNDRIFQDLEEDIGEIFPVLKEKQITHRWGGPVSVTLDMAPAIGFIGKDERAVYSLGCIGHGVSMTQYNGWTLAEMLLERESERTDVFFAGRKPIPWPPEPLRFGLVSGIRGYMRLEDAWYERKMLKD